MSERTLATVRKIKALHPIPDADRIELALVDGWQVVVQKGLYEVGDLAMYFEIDSWIPHSIAPFLTKEGKEPSVYENVPGERLRTMKLKKQLSQGLLMPLKEYVRRPDGAIRDIVENEDYSDFLGILKWERPESSVNYPSRSKGNFPAFIPKTDQARIQNIGRLIENWQMDQIPFQVTEKMDGSSMTVYVCDTGRGVCSRNLELEYVEGNSFWETALKEDLLAKAGMLAESSNHGVALQGELCGPGIQGNKYKLDTLQFFLYDIYDITARKYLFPEHTEEYAKMLGVRHVPVIMSDWVLEGNMLEMAEGKSVVEPTAEREGLVFKQCYGQDSFKAISNKWLLKNE